MQIHLFKDGKRASDDCSEASKNKKSFVYISEREGELVLAVKGLPSVNEELRESFVSIRPAWHMNKTHWNDIHFGGDVSEKQAKQMIENSYHLIKPKRE